MKCYFRHWIPGTDGISVIGHFCLVSLAMATHEQKLHHFKNSTFLCSLEYQFESMFFAN